MLFKRIHAGMALRMALLMGACTKSVVVPEEENETLRTVNPLARKPAPSPSTYQTFTIQAGNHNCDQSALKSVKTSDMKFMARFDNSAIYTTANPDNQADINKLWGFSEGFNNQYNSARIGWNWVNNALRLHAYVYNKGVRAYREITTVPIGTDINCSIRVSGSSYIFTVNGVSVTMARGTSTSTASGYQQYPYFGGDEVAPHKISIQIKPL